MKQNSEQKVLDKQKATKSVKIDVIPFIPKQDLQPSDICLYRNKILSDINKTELYSLITNAYKPPKKFDFLETDWSFVWSEKFPWVCYSRWEDGAYCLLGVLFGHKVVGSSSLKNLYKKSYQTWTAAVKTFRKHKNAPTRTLKKSQILLTRFIDEYRGKKVSINKVFDSTHKESIKKARKGITPIVDSLKL